MVEGDNSAKDKDLGAESGIVLVFEEEAAFLWRVDSDLPVGEFMHHDDEEDESSLQYLLLQKSEARLGPELSRWYKSSQSHLLRNEYSVYILREMDAGDAVLEFGGDDGP